MSQAAFHNSRLAAFFIGAAVCVGIASEVQAQSAPSNYTSATRYDIKGRVTGTIAPDPDGGGSLRYLATRTTYDARGNVTKVEAGELSAWKSEAVAPANWTGFTIHTTTQSTYDLMSRKLTDKVIGSNNTPVSLIQYSYDADGRLECTAVRMDPTRYNSLPASACTLGSNSSSAPNDRITKTVYDNAGRAIKVIKALGTSAQITDVMYAYTANGQIENVVDANGNRAKYRYDGFDRMERWWFPNKTRPTNFNPNAPSLHSAGASTPTWTDLEAYTYDNNGNRLTLRKRDGSVINYQYDALNRMTRKTVPERSGLSSTHTRDVHYTYDLRGLQAKARFNSGSGPGVTTSYDGFGRMIREYQTDDSLTTRTIRSGYDKNGNRTRITHPDGNYWQFEYDGLNRINVFRQHTWKMGWVTYNNRGLIDNNYWASSATGTSNRRDYDYDPAGRLDQIAINLHQTAGDVTWDYTRNAASQIASETQSNDSYSWDGHVNVDRAYTTNGLNQYTSAGGANFTYDANGNLTSDGSKTFLYDVENRLVKVTGGGRTTDLYYDPLGRLYRVQDSQTGQTNFVYDGNALALEYNSSGTVLRRYVHGTNAEADDPLFIYEGSGVGGSWRRFLHADPRGSIVAVANSGGTLRHINTYDEYGIPDTASGNDLATKGRFRYTGQAWIPELGMYYYKARIYSPTLGRFLQTDPIGYEDQYNLYAYVGNDPINGVDPTGLCTRNGNTDDFCEIVDNSELGDQLIDPVSDPISEGQLSDIENQAGYSEEGDSETMVQLTTPGWKLGAALADSEQARSDAKYSGEGGGHNGNADAIRHTSWNIRMERSVGARTAKTIGDAHERSGGNLIGERTMDLMNNHNGRIISQIFPNADPGTLAKAALNAGLLQQKPVVVTPRQ